MIVAADYGRGVGKYGGFEDLAGMDDCATERAYGHSMYTYDEVLAVQKQC